jgi:SAM-dependent MidA family methyltransferase
MTTDADVHEPNAPESRHAERVAAFLHERVRAAGGWLSFDAYMQIALYEPGLGYYSAGAHKLGVGGDFTTAPEISPLFGGCLAAHCDEVLQALGGGQVLEIGAGTGRLAFDLLSALHLDGQLPEKYLILEISADLRQRQQQLIATLPAQMAQRVQWLDHPPQVPWRGALIANEVIDALPVQRFVRRAGRWQALGVAVNEQGAFEWRVQPADSTLLACIEALQLPADMPEAFESEICTSLEPWLREVTATMEQGVALFVDYGLPRREYYSAARDHGTLRCHYRQRAHDDPFARPGLQDITAWVDFTRVAEAADASGLDVLGYGTQAGLLLGLGIESLVAAAPDESARIRRASEARQLLMPTEMGETFKAIALGRNYDAPLPAFKVQDLSCRL